MVGGNTFQANIDVRKVRGSEYMNFYGVKGEFLKIWKFQKICYENLKIPEK